MTTTLGLTILATCAVVMPLDTVVPSAAASTESEAALLSERSTCWMTTLWPPLPNCAPAKPPTKPMAAASTSATALLASLLWSFFCFLGCPGAAVFCSGPAGGGVTPPLPESCRGAVYSGLVASASP